MEPGTEEAKKNELKNSFYTSLIYVSNVFDESICELCVLNTQRMNLTAVTEASEVMKRHVEDSLAIIPPIQSHYLSRCDSTCDRLNLVDVGSGAGLPGLIFAIACPGHSPLNLILLLIP